MNLHTRLPDDSNDALPPLWPEPRSSTGRQRKEKQRPAIPKSRNQVNDCEEDQGGKNQDKFDLIVKAFEDEGLVVHVPWEGDEAEEYEEDEAEVN
ncbi:hypothetical protein Vadar_033748 [Vaccinium darrowii]|uniref:Uncharacterized protein n=1 Tax=Vaccinium darrowii TaxID=229202 RepID=A0ACB7ZH35_9ERIC|nr:hypothetical protein Vadar_033748 [Vaccinium darrowii]